MITAKDPTYNGPDRRKNIRRTKADRRTAIRFELNKEDRRKNGGRRQSDGDLWKQRTI